MTADADGRRRSGFGLIEIIMLLVIMTIVGALALPAMMQADRLERAQETALILDRTRLALYDVAAGNYAFRQRVGANAGHLSDLTLPIISTDKNSCNVNYGNPRVNNWVSWGPFGGFNIDPTIGMMTSIGVANDLLVRNPTGGGGGTGTLAIVIPNVDSEDAAALDLVVDTGDGLGAGAIRWSAPVGGLTSLSYLVTIDGTC